jgi:hypothetical protein
MKHIKLCKNYNEVQNLLSVITKDPKEIDDLQVLEPETPEDVITAFEMLEGSYAEGLFLYIMPSEYWEFIDSLIGNFNKLCCEQIPRETYKSRKKEIIRDCIGTIFG